MSEYLFVPYNMQSEQNIFISVAKARNTFNMYRHNWSITHSNQMHTVYQTSHQIKHWHIKFQPPEIKFSQSWFAQYFLQKLFYTPRINVHGKSYVNHWFLEFPPEIYSRRFRSKRFDRELPSRFVDSYKIKRNREYRHACRTCQR